MSGRIRSLKQVQSTYLQIEHPRSSRLADVLAIADLEESVELLTLLVSASSRAMSRMVLTSSSSSLPGFAFNCLLSLTAVWNAGLGMMMVFWEWALR